MIMGTSIFAPKAILFNEVYGRGSLSFADFIFWTVAGRNILISVCISEFEAATRSP